MIKHIIDISALNYSATGRLSITFLLLNQCVVLLFTSLPPLVNSVQHAQLRVFKMTPKKAVRDYPLDV